MPYLWRKSPHNTTRAIVSLKLIIPSTLHSQLIAHALQTPTQECCGYLLGTTTPPKHTSQYQSHSTPHTHYLFQLYPLPNTHPNPQHFFAFSPLSQLQVFTYLKTQQNLQIIGIYHSHPTSPPILSQTDKSYIFSPYQSNLIISLKDGIKIASYRIINQKILKENIQIYQDVEV